MFQYIILTQYEYQEISKNWPGENHFGSAGLPPTLEMRKLKSERLRLVSRLAPNFHLPFVQFLQPSPLNFPVPIWASQFPTPTSPISSGPSPPSNFNFHLSNLPCPGFPPPSNCFECWQIRSVLSGVQPRAFPFGCQMAHHGRSHRKRVGGELNSQVPEHLA